MTHPHDDFETALDETVKYARIELAEDLPAIVKRVLKAHTPSTAGEHEAAIAEYAEDKCVDFIRSVADLAEKWQMEREHQRNVIARFKRSQQQKTETPL